MFSAYRSLISMIPCADGPPESMMPTLLFVQNSEPSIRPAIAMAAGLGWSGPYAPEITLSATSGWHG